MTAVDAASPAAAFHDFETLAFKCRTPKQFHELLNRLQALIPYRNLICSWGYPASGNLGFVFNHSFPVEFVRWYLTKGMLQKSPVFQEWLRTKRTQVWLDVARSQKAQFDPEVLERVERWHLQHMLCGGSVTHDLFLGFAVNMGSQQSCHAHLERFDMVMPIVSQALKRASPRPLLSSRETGILQSCAMGEKINRIATGEGIAIRTVRMHLERIKKKLYTDDLVNAVMIASKSGMLDQTWKEWHWPSEKASHPTTERVGVRTHGTLALPIVLVPVQDHLPREGT